MLECVLMVKCTTDFLKTKAISTAHYIPKGRLASTDTDTLERFNTLVCNQA